MLHNIIGILPSGFGALEIPVTEIAPDEVIKLVHSFLHPELAPRFVQIAGRFIQARQDPTIMEM
jgi:hypothetical protein